MLEGVARDVYGSRPTDEPDPWINT